MAEDPEKPAANPLLRAIIEASNFGIVVLDAEGRIVTWNPWLAAHTAVAETQVLGKTLADAMAGIPQGTVELCAEALRTGRPRILSPALHETLIPLKKPSQQLGRLYPTQDERGRVSGVALCVYDISQVLEYEQFAAAEAAAERRERGEIFQAIGHPALILDRECNILAANTAAAGLTGCAPRELVGKKCHRVMHCTELSPPGCPLTRMLETGVLETEEITMAALGRVFLVSCTPLCDPAGNLDKVIHIAMDITDRKQAEEELSAKNRDLAVLNSIAVDLASVRAGRDVYTYLPTKLKALTGAATATFGLYDPHLREIQVKHAEVDRNLASDLLRLLGGKKLTEAAFPVGDAIRRDLIANPVRIQNTLSEVTFGLVPPWVGKVAQKVQKIDRFVGIAYVLDGELYGTTVLGLRTGRPDPSLELLRSFANLAAVSLKRGKAEESLRLSRERYSAFVAQSSDAICRFEIVHPPIDTTLAVEAQIDHLYNRAVIKECNLLFATSHGYAEPEEMIDRDIGQIYPRVEKENVDFLRSFIEKGYRMSDMETRERSGDGSIRFFLNSLSGHVENGGLVRIWGVRSDITRIKKAEAEIRALNADLERRIAERTAQLELSNKELETFVYSVSHDLRAPLRAIDGYSRMLLEDFAPQLDAEGRRLCSNVSENSRNMRKLIDDLLAFARIGWTEMESSSIDMATLASDIFLESTSLEERERIDFQVAPLPGARGDPSLIRQVWTNLLSNAVKFSAKKERARIEVEAEFHKDEIVYAVRDNGAGFDMAFSPKLFGVFQRLHTQKEFEGSGVGLSIVKHIVQRHGGRIWAVGTPGEGATFYFTLGKGD